MMSSDSQLEQTGVDRDAGRLKSLGGLAGSWFKLNGLSSNACFMWWPVADRNTYPGERIASR